MEANNQHHEGGQAQLPSKCIDRYVSPKHCAQDKPAAMFQRFRQIYDLQANGSAFETPQALLSRIGLHQLTQQSTRRYLAVRQEFEHWAR